ncbi:MAG: cyclic-di-AMP receptor [Fimbriimonadaceae bacterium]
MKLAICIVQDRDRGKITDEFVKAGFKFTMMRSTGGFLQRGNCSFFVGLEDEEIPAIKDIVSRHCQAREQVVNVAPIETSPQESFIPNPVKVPVGGAVMFILDVEQFERF